MMMQCENGDFVKQTCFLIPLTDAVNELTETIPDMDVSLRGIKCNLMGVVAGVIQLAVNELFLFKGNEVESGRYTTHIVDQYVAHDDKLSLIENVSLGIMKTVQSITGSSRITHDWNYKLINLHYLVVCINEEDFCDDKEDTVPG